MESPAVLVVALIAVAFAMYWIFSATARHAEREREALRESRGTLARISGDS